MSNLGFSASGLGTKILGFRSRRAPAFSLLELLLVIAVVTVLCALLSAAFNNAKNKAVQIGCVNNLRQLQLAWLMYVDEDQYLLPLNQSEASSNTKLFGRRNKPGSWVLGNPKEDITTDNLAKGSLFPWINNPRVFRCPGDTARVIGQKNFLRNRSYSMSAYMNGDGAGVDPRVKTHYSEILNPPPERVFVLIEEHELSPWNGAFMIGPAEAKAGSPLQISSLPAERHWDGCNLSFADGHVEYWKWLRPEKYPLKQLLIPQSHDVNDLRHLQNSIPNQ